MTSQKFNKSLLTLALILIGSAALALPTWSPVSPVVNPATGTLYAANNDASPVIKVYAASEITGWNSAAVQSLSLTGSCYGLAVNSDGTKLYASISDGASSLIKIYNVNSSTGQLTAAGSMNMNGHAWSQYSIPSGLAINPAGTKLFAADKAVARILMFDLATNKCVAEKTYTSASPHFDVAATDSKIFVSSKSDPGKISVYTYSGNTITYNETFNTDQYPGQVQVYGNRLYVAVNDGATGGIDIRVYSTSSHALVGSLKNNYGLTGEYGWTCFAITPDGEWLLYKKAGAANESTNELFKKKLSDISGTVNALHVASVNKADGLAVNALWEFVALTYSPTGAIQIVSTGMTRPNDPPAKASNLKIYENDGTTVVPNGAVTDSNRLWGEFKVSDPDAGDLISGDLQYIRIAPQTGPNGHVVSAAEPSGTTVKLHFPSTGMLVNGVWKWYVISTDTQGATSFSDEKTFRVDTAGPVATINLPADGATVAGNPVTIIANIDDTQNGLSTITGAEYFIDLPSGPFAIVPAGGSGTAMTLNHPTGTHTSEGATGSWNTYGLPNGTHTISVRGLDAFGHWGAFDKISVTVQNIAGPTVTSINPNNAERGQTVYIINLLGTNFQSGATVSLLPSLGLPIAATNVNVLNATTISCEFAIPAVATLGLYDVVVTNPDTQKGQLDDGFTVYDTGTSPTITSIVPSSGNQNSTVNVTITGTGFDPAGVTATLAKTGQSDLAINVTNVTATTITGSINIPAGAATGLWTVLVTNNADQHTAELYNGFAINPAGAPLVLSIDPDNGQQNQTVNIINLKGQNFATSGTVFVQLTKAGQPNIIATNVNVLDSQTISCDLALGTSAVGDWNVVVTNPGGLSGQLPNGFTIYSPITPSPTITSITPNTGGQGTNTSVTIAGTNFHLTGATVKLARTGQADIVANNVVVSSATQITCVLPIPAGALLGQWTVLVTNTDDLHTGELYNGFTITTAGPAPTVTSIDPNNGVQGTTITIINLKGTNFVSGATVKLTRSGQLPINATGVTVVNPTTITCSLTLSGIAGQWDVVVVNPDAQFGTLANGFTIFAPGTAPTISSINPNTGAQGTTVPVTITGTNYISGATAKIAKTGETNIALTGVTVVNSTTITGNIPLGAATALGAWTVMVTNPDTQTGQLVDGFTVTTGGGGTITDLSIVRVADAVGSSVMVSWKTDPTLHAAVDIYTRSGAFTTDVTPGNWIKVTSPVIIPNGDLDTFTDPTQVGQGTVKYYKIVPSGHVLVSGDLSQDVAGKYDVHIAAGGFTLMSLPLITTSTSLQSVIGDQLTAGWDPSTAGTVYGDNSGSWNVAWKDQSSGTWLDTAWQPASLIIEPDKAYWIFDPNEKNVTLVGTISNVARTINMVAGWNFVGSAYPNSTTIQTSGLDACTPGWDPSTAGTLYQDNNGSWVIAWKDQASGNWLDAAWQPSTMSLEPGKGYWFYEPANPFVWQYPKSY
jgi:hypothetical protein